MQITHDEQKSSEWLTTIALLFFIGIGIGLFGVVISQMGLLNGLIGGGETAVSANNINLSAQKMRFGQEEIRLKVGETVTFTLDNNDYYAHSFDTDDFDVHAAMPANSQVTATFTATEPGTFDFYCGVPGHMEAGMVGTIIVEP